MNRQKVIHHIIPAVMLAGFSLINTVAWSSPLPAKINSIFAYDPREASGQIQIGAFVDAINQFNSISSGSHQIKEIYSYGGDMEMYCPGGVVADCTGSDLYVFYSRSEPVSGSTYSNASTFAYHQGIDPNLIGSQPLVAPIIDGTVVGSGPLAGFDNLSRRNAQFFADKVAHRICADPYAAGVEMDLEPFDVATRNAQYYFYLRLAKDLSIAQTKCVNAQYPQGRFFAVFTGANAINPASASAARVAKILNAYHNGYLIDPLYDLASSPAGYRTSVSDYARLVAAQTINTVNWAADLGIHYQFDVPAAASFHDYASCIGPLCGGASAPADGQVDYVSAAENAIIASGAQDDPLYMGTAVWAMTGGIKDGQTAFQPQSLTSTVETFLAGAL